MLSVVVPCFNERENVERFPDELIAPLKSLDVPFEIIAVDDGSTDGTNEALRRLDASNLTVAAHDSNQGLGAALRTGFARAAGEWIATLDADMTFDPRQIAGLLQKQKESNADLVAGSPFLSKEGLAAVPWRRRIPSLALNAFYRGLLRPDFGSYTPIFRLYRAQPLKILKLEGAGFEINAEIAAEFVKAGLKLAEGPALLGTRRHGVSKTSATKDLCRHARLIGRLL